MAAGKSFAEVLTAAINDMAANGFDSVSRLEYWQLRLRAAAEAEVSSPLKVEEMLRQGLGAIYARQGGTGAVLKATPGVSRFTLENIKPKLRAELTRRIAVSADLIKLNRKQA